MSLARNQSESNLPVSIGSAMQVVAATGLAATIASSGSINSELIQTNGYKNIAFGITSDQAGTVSIQRYIDAEGTIPQGAAITGTLVAATALTVNNNDGAAFQSMMITVSNSAGSTANLTGVMLLLQAY
jgi:hypothetical protein